MDNWISVDDRLPAPQKNVLVYYKNKCGKYHIVRAMYIPPFTVDAQGFFEDLDDGSHDYSEAEDKYYVKCAWYEVVDNWSYESCEISFEKVTHWQPLPEPPRGE